MADKKRRIRIHRGLTFGLAVVVTVVIAVLVFQRSGFLSYQLSQYVNDHYFRDTPFRFSCGEVKSDLVSRASVANPVIRYEDDSRSVKVFSAKEIAIEYSVIEALRLKVIIDRLEVDRPKITLWRDDDGKAIVPYFDGGSSSGTASPHIEILAFEVEGLEIETEGAQAPYAAKSVDLTGSARYMDGKAVFEISGGNGRFARGGTEVTSLRARAEVEGGGVALRELTVHLEESFVMVSGGYEGKRLVNVQAVFNPLDLGEISSIGWLEEEGEVGGSVLVNGTLDSLLVAGSLTGHALGLVFSGLSLEGVVSPDRVVLSKLDGEVHGSRLRGTAAYDRITGSWGFDGTCEGLDLTEGFLPDRGVPPTELNGAVRVDHDAVAKTYEIGARLENSMISGFEGQRIRFAGAWSERSGLTMRALEMERPGVTITGFGSIDARDRADVVLRLEGDDLDYLMDYLALPRIGGSVDLAGRITGPLDNLQLNANGNWLDLDYLGAVIDSSRVLFDARGLRSDDPEATIDVLGRRIRLAGAEFSSPHLLLEAEDGRAVVRDFRFSKGDTVLTSHFDVRSSEAETEIHLKHLAVETPDVAWRSRGTSIIRSAGGATEIDSLVLSANGSAVAVSGWFSEPTNTGEVRLRGTNVDFSLVPVLTGSRLKAGGTGRVDAVIRGDFENPDVELFLEARDGFVGDLGFSRLMVRGDFSGNEYHLDRLSVFQGEDSLVASARWAHAQSPVAAVRRGLDKEKAWEADIVIEASGQGFPMDRLLERVRGGARVSAAFSGDAKLYHTLRSPRVELSGVIRSAAGSQIAIPDIHTKLEYESGRLLVQSLSADDGKNRITVSGVVPLGFDIERGFEFNPRSDVDFKADVDLRDLSIVAGHVGAIAAAAGRLSGSLEALGPAEAPEFEGRFSLRNAAFRLAGSNEVYRDVSADVNFHKDRITVDPLRAKKGNEGTLQARGAATLKGFEVSAYALDATLSDFSFSTIPGFESIQNGEISVKSHDDGGRLIPSVTGDLRVKEAVITRSLAGQEGPPSPWTVATESPSWLCDLDLHAPKNVWLRNPDVNVEMGGDVTLKRDREGFYLRGDLRVLRGSYTLYNNKFRITDGRFDFATATLRPGIYLDAFTPHRRSGDTEYKIFLSFSWPADEEQPEITLSYSEPGYSEADIWAMLGGQVVAGSGFGDQGAWNAGETAASLASNYLERILNAQMSDVTVAVESSPAGDGSRTGDDESTMTIAIGSYLSEDLYLNYRQGLRTTSAREVDIEYRLSNILLLRSEIIQHSQRGILGKSRQTTDEINFDIKLRWEY